LELNIKTGIALNEKDIPINNACVSFLRTVEIEDEHIIFVACKGENAIRVIKILPNFVYHFMPSLIRPSILPMPHLSKLIVTCLAKYEECLIAGYNDGVIIIWHLSSILRFIKAHQGEVNIIKVFDNGFFSWSNTDKKLLEWCWSL